MPSYVKFLKDFLFNKGYLRMLQCPFTKECSVIIQNMFSLKRSDLGSFSTPCSLEDVTISRVLCDLGASVSLMPYSISKNL